MSRAINRSWNHLGVGRDGVLEALPFRAWIYHRDFCRETSDSDDEQWCEGKIYRVEWHTLNLHSGKISETLSTMPLGTRHFGTAVACNNRVYVLGGTYLGDSYCPDENCFHPYWNDCVSYLDCASHDCEWKQAPPMLVPRYSPAAIATPGKIFVFGSVGRIGGPFAEVFNTELNRWDTLTVPVVVSDWFLQFAPSVLYQSSRSRILVHFFSDNSLQAFNLISESWECLDPQFGNGYDISVIVDDVIYSIFEQPNSVWCDDVREHFRAYHLVDKKWLDVKWLSKLPVPAPCSGTGIKLFHLGNDLMCLAWYSRPTKCIDYIKFCVRFDSGIIYSTVVKDEEIRCTTTVAMDEDTECATTVVKNEKDEKNEETEESIIEIPFQSFYSEFMLV